MNNRSIGYWILVGLMVYLLWPILKWLILILLVALVVLFIYLKTKTKVFTTTVKWDDGTQNKDYYEKSRVSHDVIYVEYKTKEEKKD